MEDWSECCPASRWCCIWPRKERRHPLSCCLQTAGITKSSCCWKVGGAVGSELKHFRNWMGFMLSVVPGTAWQLCAGILLVAGLHCQGNLCEVGFLTVLPVLWQTTGGPFSREQKSLQKETLWSLGREFQTERLEKSGRLACWDEEHWQHVLV